MKLSRFIVMSLIAAAMGVSVVALSWTDWAARVRARSRRLPPIAELLATDRNRPLHVNYASPILKVAVFMGIPGVITLAVVKLVSPRRRKTGAFLSVESE